MTPAQALPCLVSAWAKRTPERNALRTTTGALSWREWDDRICRCATALRDNGVVAGSRVAITLPTGVDILVLLPALFRLGAVACPIDPRFPHAYRDALVKQLECSLVLAEMPALAAMAHDPDTRQGPRWIANKPATIIFTSGSSGSPKAAVLSLENHLASAQASNDNIALAAQDTWLLSLPLHHVAGFGILFRCLVAGATIALPDDLPPSEAIPALGATHVSLVARQLAVLLDDDSLPPLKAILLGGSSIPGDLLDRATAADLPVHTSYGMTEMATQVTTTPPGATRAELNSAGKPLMPGSIRIGEGGLLHVNGRARFLGYWSEGKISRPFDDHGWFRTGDRGYIDPSGFLHIEGRADLMFVAGGENIQPEEIERALLGIPGVIQALVVPVPHDTFGSTPAAFVETDGLVKDENIQAQLHQTLPRFKVPRHWFPWPKDDRPPGLKINRTWFMRHAACLVKTPPQND